MSGPAAGEAEGDAGDEEADGDEGLGVADAPAGPGRALPAVVRVDAAAVRDALQAES
jgi:hypothetical protein